MTSPGGAPILLCYDGSDGARQAIAWAGAMLPGHEVVVLHLWDSPALDGAFAPELGDGERQRSRAVARADEGCEIAGAAGLLPRPFPAGIGVSWQSVLAVSRSEHARAIVLGAGEVGDRRSGRGSLVRGVVHHASIPVVVVPSPAPAPAVQEPAPSILIRALSSFGGSARQDALARYLLLEAAAGRDVAEIFEVAYLERRADHASLELLLDRRDVIEGLGREATDGIRARIAALG